MGVKPTDPVPKDVVTTAKEFAEQNRESPVPVPVKFRLQLTLLYVQNFCLRVKALFREKAGGT